jgi:hypothetical protein
MRFLLTTMSVVSMIAASASISRAEISLSTIDTFSTNNNGYSIGANGVQPTRVAQTGPDGQVGYLTHFSDGAQTQNRWLMWNTGSQWTGNYVTAGVTGFKMEANVTAGTSPAAVRVAFDGPGGWFYSPAQNVASGWATYTFPIDVATWTRAAGGGTGRFSDTSTAVTKFEIISGPGLISHSGGADILRAQSSTNTILFDNIQAVPEPVSSSMAVAAGLAIACVARRRHGMAGQEATRDEV